MHNPYITHGSSKIGGGLISNWISGWWFGCHFLFSHILGISSSQLTVIFFRGVAQPPTRYGSFGVSCWFLLVGRSCRIWKPKVSKSDHHPTAKKWQESPGGLFSDAFGAPESWVGEALDEWVTIFDPRFYPVRSITIPKSLEDLCDLIWIPGSQQIPRGCSFRFWNSADWQVAADGWDMASAASIWNIESPRERSAASCFQGDSCDMEVSLW